MPLIVRLPNWVGDVMMTLPSLQALHHAGFDLQLFGKKWVLDLLQAFPAKLIQMPDTLLGARSAISHLHTKNALLLTNSFSSAVVMRLAGKQPIGYKNDLRGFLLKHKMTKLRGLHEVVYFWEIAKLATAICLPHVVWSQSIPHKINLPINPACVMKIAKKLRQEAIATSWIVLCPSATGKGKNGISKIWPYWSSLSEILNQRGIIHVVCPGPGEEARCRELTPKARFITGLTLSELAAVFSHARLVLANDSGPMHLAAAVGTSVLGIFGATNPERTFPWGGNYMGMLGKWPSIDDVLEYVNGSF